MSSQNLAKNTTLFASAMAIQKVLSFLYFTMVARSIGVANMGKYSFALSFSTIFAMILDLGVTQILIRESAIDKERSQKQLSTVIGFKLLASLVIYGALVLIANLLGYPQITKELVYIAGIVMLIDSFTLSFYGVIRGHQNLSFESLGIILNQAIVLIVGFIVLKLDLGLQALMGVYLVGSIINFAYSLALLRIKFKIFPSIDFNWLRMKQLLIIAIPFAIAGIFIRIYSSMDVIILSKISGDHAVGIYSIATKILFALQFVAMAFSATLYPSFSHCFVHSKELLAKNFTKSIYYLLILSLPLVTGVIFIADKVIVPVFGKAYEPTILPLQIIIGSLILIFICFPVGAMLNACNRQTRNTVNLGIVAGFNIIINLILIPFYSYVGAAIATLLSYGLLFILGIVVVDKIVVYDKKYLLIALLKNLFSSAVMALFIILTKNHWHFIIVIPVAAIIYFAVLYIIKGFDKEDIQEIISKIIPNKFKKYEPTK
ncbi:MAG: flippase [Patescibacteria group bacterium]|jgi:O-antigen/teichoic acid export membrane protein